MEELQNVNVMSPTRGHFLSKALGLPSVPMACTYIGMILFSTYWQKFTKPLELKKILLVYNMTCSVLSLYTAGLFLNGLRSATSIFQKEPISELQSAFFIYWLLKNMELLDTVFMILRHKKRQISFLHVYHHCSMLILSDLTYHYYPWPAIAPFLAFNSIIHVFLYFYYGQSALNPIQRPAWKQRMTQMQILQFLVDLILAAWGYAFHGFCIYSLFYGFTMLSLFSNFYYKAFIKKKST
ncbi:elongation of very long chain fatty acids protein 5 [Callorhinchus milii]|uniref:Elongation of very long chain fatty acids protein n=2 Tax=Callorhinchus milii TaxID=7868 RepID=A0A4W3HSY0_CALMI|nr:elongation of very long chain fatty acids protein 5 [Callorhinchus milii]XP_007896748.1 elongation of very long chain fatty acids protein 5 [Callorhinchus milii]XP_007896758.1 elongation of very long chain fatty acids protein 5 [Callorhinchus milii]|eukprot:gi/632936954/ref/XP_007896740.1/ PREDICTED: elongation of very long chain fatty acids protein 1-like [Callorhinchus milii]